jgi:hypothetical protein
MLRGFNQAGISTRFNAGVLTRRCNCHAVRQTDTPLCHLISAVDPLDAADNTKQ